MVPFKIKFNPGQSIFDQVCFAAIKSILAGELKAGELSPPYARSRWTSRSIRTPPTRWCST
jgi:hypothetical protein